MDAPGSGDRPAGAASGDPEIRLDCIAGIPAYVRRRVAEIVAAEQVGRHLPPAPTVRGRIEALVPAETSLAEAHAIWLPGYLAELPGLAPFGAQPPQAAAPPGLVRVAIECVTGPSGGMSSFHGFQGWFVSLLVSIPRGCVWDSRIEAAT